MFYRCRGGYAEPPPYLPACHAESGQFEDQVFRHAQTGQVHQFVFFAKYTTNEILIINPVPCAAAHSEPSIREAADFECVFAEFRRLSKARA